MLKQCSNTHSHHQSCHCVNCLLSCTFYTIPVLRIFNSENLYLATSSYASAVLAVVALSVCLSVRHTRALRQNQAMHFGYFDTTQNGNYSSFLTPTAVGGRRPFPSKSCAQSDPPPFENADFDRSPLITSQP